MFWSLKFTAKARKQLKKLDPQTQREIIYYFEKKVLPSNNPTVYGKWLSGELSNIYRYRIGDMRVLCQIKKRQLIVEALKIEHRSTVYK